MLSYIKQRISLKYIIITSATIVFVFSVLFSWISRQETQLILEQIAKFPITYKDKEISLTATMGVSDYSDEEATINDLIKRSDKAMRKGKAQGKNRVVIL